MSLEWIVAVILWVNPAWGPHNCVEDDAACIANNTARQAALIEYAGHILRTSAVEQQDPLMVLSDIETESSISVDPNPCPKRLPASRVLSVTQEAGEDPGVMRIRFRNWTGEEKELVAWKVSQGQRWVRFDTCWHGEQGRMQILTRSRWGQAGYEIPGFPGEVLADDFEARTAQLRDPRINTAIGVREMSDMADAAREARAEWWRWIGAYNTGDLRVRRAWVYAKGILSNYNQYCQNVRVANAEGVSVRLREVYEGCENVGDARRYIRRQLRRFDNAAP